MSRVLHTRTKYKLVGSDYSAQEPRLTAFMSQDPAMMQAYAEGKDLYAVIAQSMYNNAYEDNLECYPEGTILEIDGKQIVCGKKTHINEEGKNRRSSAKTMLLAILYGMSAGTAGRRMGKTAAEGRALMDNFFAKFPKVKLLIEQSKADLAKNGYVEDWAGRRRHLPDYFLPDFQAEYVDKKKILESTFNPFFGCSNREFTDTKLMGYVQRANRMEADAKNSKFKRFSNESFSKLAAEALKKDGIELIANTGRKAQAERQCLNARIQGGAASLTKLAMVNIFNDQELNDMQAKLVITVHDEVLVECPAFYADKVEKRLPQVMIDTAKPYINVPMACDPYSVDRWYLPEYTTSVKNEVKKLEEGNPKKNIEPVSREEALQRVSAAHPEVSIEAIEAAVSGKTELIEV